jgi:hypothetical protein
MNTLNDQQTIAGKFDSGGIHVRNRILNYLKFEWCDMSEHPEIYEQLILDNIFNSFN